MYTVLLCSGRYGRYGRYGRIVIHIIIIPLPRKATTRPHGLTRRFEFAVVVGIQESVEFLNQYRTLKMTFDDDLKKLPQNDLNVKIISLCEYDYTFVSRPFQIWLYGYIYH